MANYLLTGTAGFIAARVAEFLLKDGHTILGVDNMNDAYDVRMKEYRLARLKKQAGFTFQKLDVSDRAAVEALAGEGPKIDAVINLAARAGVRASTEDPWACVDTNITGTLNLLELCRHNDIPKFILASTSSVYGADAPLPTPESHDTSFPLQPYAASKKGAETLSHSYHYLYDIDVTVFRYFTVYGPAGRPDMAMFRFAHWLIEGRPLLLNGDGNQSRAFTYLDDIARGTILGLNSVGFEIMNLGGHESITINDLIALMEEMTGKKAQIEKRAFHKADMTANWADVEKASTLLNWNPKISLQDGVSKLIEWYMAEREWVSQIKFE